MGKDRGGQLFLDPTVCIYSGVEKNQWSTGPGSAKNEKDFLKLTQDGPASHHVNTTYLEGSIYLYINA